jgi:general secretion pathway protein G
VTRIDRGGVRGHVLPAAARAARGGATFCRRGFTLVELVLSVSLIVMVAGLALPVAHTMERRARELELRQDLRLLRRAIDSYHFTVQAVPSAKKNATAEDWPEELKILVEGVDLGLAKEVKVKFLRRIPKDPMTGKDEWGLRGFHQDADDDMWDGTNIFDVFSKAEGKALDGSSYRDW